MGRLRVCRRHREEHATLQTSGDTVTGYHSRLRSLDQPVLPEQWNYSNYFLCLQGRRVAEFLDQPGGDRNQE
jgi:hypothetical protein